MRRGVVLLLLMALLPLAAEAQRRPSSWDRGNAFSFSPYIGAYKDAYDLEADGSDLGWMVGFKAGYGMSERLRLQASLAYAEANDVGTHGLDGRIFDNEWVLLTGGAEFALVPGNTSIALGGEAGVGWRRTPVKNATLPGDDGWGSYDLIVPSLSLRHRISDRAGLFLTAQDMIFDALEGNAKHSPALTAGLTFR